nr:MAG TPA: inner membrane protein [Caudoviricetes sp.]
MGKISKLCGGAFVNYEIVGIIATIVVLLSFTMTKCERIRIVNMVGAAIYCLYGHLIKSPSTIILNGALIAIHTFFLVKRK